MPLFFFNVIDGYSHCDETGTDLPDIYTAQAQAIRLSAELLAEMGTRFWDGIAWRLEVADEQGRILFVFRFAAEERMTLSYLEPGPHAP